jgi:hypothetical protein
MRTGGRNTFLQQGKFTGRRKRFNLIRAKPGKTIGNQ